jgi:hypothetical protein
MKRLILFFAFCAGALAQQTYRFSATTGDVSLSAAGTTATIQQPATNQSQVELEQAVVYCSVNCSITQAANGTAAANTAGTVRALLPTQLAVPIPVNFFTASDVGAGTAQGGIIHVVGPGTVVICFNVSCGATQSIRLNTGQGAAANYSITIGSITGTANITFFGRVQ